MVDARPSLNALLALARDHRMTPAERREQRISFVMGQYNFDRPPEEQITRAQVIEICGLGPDPEAEPSAMAGAHLSDAEVASRVRMLRRTDIDHEAVCTMARDRIVHLSQQVARLRAGAADIEISHA